MTTDTVSLDPLRQAYLTSFREAQEALKERGVQFSSLDESRVSENLLQVYKIDCINPKEADLKSAEEVSSMLYRNGYFYRGFCPQVYQKEDHFFLRFSLDWSGLSIGASIEKVMKVLRDLNLKSRLFLERTGISLEVDEVANLSSNDLRDKLYDRVLYRGLYPYVEHSYGGKNVLIRFVSENPYSVTVSEEDLAADFGTDNFDFPIMGSDLYLGHKISKEEDQKKEQ